MASTHVHTLGEGQQAQAAWQRPGLLRAHGDLVGSSSSQHVAVGVQQQQGGGAEAASAAH